MHRTRGGMGDLPGQSHIEELSKMLMRKFRSIKYENVHLPPKYVECEEEYKRLRECLQLVESAIIKNLESYEHGNRVYKSIKSGMQFINDKASLNMYRNTDIYEDVAGLGASLCEVNDDPKYKAVGKKCQEAYESVSSSKKEFNGRLKGIALRVKKMKETTHEIDSQRKKVKNMRYDLEVLCQDGGYRNEIRETEEKQFKKQLAATQELIENFVDTNEVPKIIKDISIEYRQHLEESASALKFVG
ncbi:hypothetical protein PAPHI01_0302 [Pancytospora philotis]|nr:hypothetical protein PAPHI01_0302 [Pancytospora philotis]